MFAPGCPYFQYWLTYVRFGGQSKVKFVILVIITTGPTLNWVRASFVIFRIVA